MLDLFATIRSLVSGDSFASIAARRGAGAPALVATGTVAPARALPASTLRVDRRYAQAMRLSAAMRRR